MVPDREKRSKIEDIVAFIRQQDRTRMEAMTRQDFDRMAKEAGIHASDESLRKALCQCSYTTQQHGAKRMLKFTQAGLNPLGAMAPAS